MRRDKVVGMVATFSDNKDYKTFILAANIVLQERMDVIFLAIGDGKNMEMSKTYLNPIFIDRFMFLGRQNDVESIINLFDLNSPELLKPACRLQKCARL